MTALIDHKRGVLLGPGPAAVAPDEVAGEQQHPQQQQDGGGHDNEHHLLLCEGAEDACTAGVGDCGWGLGIGDLGLGIGNMGQEGAGGGVRQEER
eukprot:CAMPEP_0173284644 /NCGR_PEP_ID=MMETSP1143-20121109/8155_1 /TAXON_ID=483371 /ORGANISM="non described non described, Strain CCMP2298" /LENGTH=94 /DNA_ID=CAMNT_0014222679 /DNA_START=253 /DNA_END=537 /DNA_ORIENTATION=+